LETAVKATTLSNKEIEASGLKENPPAEHRVAFDAGNDAGVARLHSTSATTQIP
jgi:hypothetical protein